VHVTDYLQIAGIFMLDIHPSLFVLLVI